jgi:hypothetical protein
VSSANRASPGFLRMLCDGYGIAERFGYDPASAAIADARRLPVAGIASTLR